MTRPEMPTSNVDILFCLSFVIINFLIIVLQNNFDSLLDKSTNVVLQWKDGFFVNSSSLSHTLYVSSEVIIINKSTFTMFHLHQFACTRLEMSLSHTLYSLSQYLTLLTSLNISESFLNSFWQIINKDQE